MKPDTPTSIVLVAALGWTATAAAQASDRDHLRHNVLAQMPWQELGPVAFGGRIVDFAVHPDDRYTWWVAAASGGLWKTTNNGISFTAQFQDQDSISIGDLAVAPSAPDTLYVGTGEANNQRSSYWGNGVYRSDDGGATWRHVGLDGTEHIGRIVVHPTHPDLVYVAALGALYKPNPDRGLYRSRDGGETWDHVKFLDEDTGFVDVAIDPQEPNVLYAASYERRRRAWNFAEGGRGSRLWKSTDGGDTWTQLEGGLPAGDLGRIGIDLFRGDPKTLYVCIENLNPAAPVPEPASTSDDEGPDNRDGDRDGAAAARDRRLADAPAEVLADPLAREQWLAGDEEDAAQDPVRVRRSRLVGGEVYRSDDAGATWTKTHADDVSIGGSPGYYYGQIRVDPSDADTVYVLSVPVHRSTDGGKTWTPQPRQRGGRGGRRGGGREGRGARQPAFHGNLHVDHHALWIDPTDSAHCLLGNDGGLGITWDAGATWDHVARLPLAQFYAVGIDNKTPYTIYGGLQDNGSWGFPVQPSESRGLLHEDAFRIGGGDGFYVVCDPSDPDVVYSESQFGGMSRQDLRTGERKGIKPRAPKGSPDLRFNWMTPIVLSPHAPHTVYVGSQYLHRSRNRGDDWTIISPDLSTNDALKLEGDVPHCTITTISESPRREGMLWVGTDDGRVWLSRNGGDRWTELTDRFGDAPQGLWVSRVEASPHDADTAFVAFTGYREDRREPLLFRTDDAGETFLPIHNDLPQESINVVRCHPTNARVLLVGTERGAHVSIDDGAAWHPLGNGLPRTAVHDLVVHPTEHHVIVGTHGRGIWILDGKALAELDAGKLQQPLCVLPPSDGVVLPRSYDDGYDGARRWSAGAPFTTATFRFVLRDDSADKVRVEVVDAAGEVLFEREVDGTAGYHEVAWQPQRGGGGRGGFGGVFGGRGGRAGSPQRPGRYAVRISHGDSDGTRAFAVHDRRRASTALGATPGVGAAGPPVETEAELTGEAAEQAEATPAGGARRTHY